MNLAIDISQIIHKGTGVARFTGGLVDSILEFDTDNTWTFFFSSLRKSLDSELAEDIEKHQHILKTAKIPPTLLEMLWNRLHIVKAERFVGNVDWYISSDWTEPPSRANKATVVHDLAFMRFPETVASSIRAVQKRRLSYVKKETHIIFADSETTKTDLIDLLAIEKDRIKVLYPGVTIQVPTLEDITRTQFKHNLHKPFILSVGKIEPRKNLKRLIAAYKQLQTDEVDLVIVGPPGWEDLDEPEHRNIRLLGYVSDTQLYALYSMAICFVFPSLFEGFGYPAVEAMKLGCPVALSNTSSLAEIGKDSAHMFDPLSVEDIHKTLYSMIHNQKYRKTYIEAAKEKSKQYTWKRYYSSMIKALQGYK
ncbi:MAG: hypothetical protein RI947_1053 [Candidatus Parcubacteria bacterium]|jgi:glycosyltransferase involved in cell wall biosynthesis